MPVKPSFPQLQLSNPLSQGLVLALPFSEGSGTTVNDLSGQGNNGVLEGGVTWTGGQSGYCLEFDGSTGYVSIPASTSLTFGTGDFTLACWFNTSLATTYQALIAQDNYLGGRNWVFDVGRTGQVVEFVGVANSGSAIVTGVKTYTLGTWNLACAVMKGGTCYLYLNAQLDISGLTGQNFNSSLATWIGNRQVNDIPFKGFLDAPLIYPFALTPQQISQLYEDSFSIYRPSKTIFKSSIVISPSTFSAAGIASSSFAGASLKASKFTIAGVASMRYVGIAYRFRSVKPKPSFAKLNYSSPFSQGIVGCWAMTEGSGNILTDVANGANATATNTNYTWTGGQGGWALKINSFSTTFAGTDKYLPFGNSPRTMAIWIKTPYVAGNSSYFQYGGDYYWQIRTSNPLLAFIIDANLVQPNPPVAIADNNWHFIAVTFDGSNLSFYCDAQLVIHVTGYTAVTTLGGASALEFEGDGCLLDMASIWNRSLSQQEIGNLTEDPYVMLQPSPSWFLESHVVISPSTFTAAGDSLLEVLMLDAVAFMQGSITVDEALDRIKNYYRTPYKSASINPLRKKWRLTQRPD